MGFWFLWDVLITGPGGLEYLRISNRRYVLRSGIDAGQPYHDAWTAESFARFEQKRQGLKVAASGAARTQTIVRELTTVEVSNYKLKDGGGLAFDYLFGAGYTPAGTVVGRKAEAKPWQDQPEESDFSVWFTGRLSKRPKKSDDGQLVAFTFEPTLSATRGPLLTRRFTGMGGHLVNVTAKPIITDAGDAPAGFVSGDFTVQLYVSVDTAVDNTLWRLVASPGTSALLGFYVISATTLLNFQVKTASGLDTYTVADLSAAVYAENRFQWLTLVWRSGDGELDFYIGRDLILDSEPILNAPSGTPYQVQLGPGQNTVTKQSAARGWTRALTAAEVRQRLGPFLTVDKEAGLAFAFEADRREGEIVTDDSGAGFDISLGAPVSQWGSDAVEGEAEDAGKVIPAAFGDCLLAPVRIYDQHLFRGLIAAGLDDIYTLYASGMPLVSDRGSYTDTFAFDKTKKKITAGTNAKEFGLYWVRGQEVEVTTTTTKDGVYVLQDLVPRRRLRPQSDYFQRVAYVEAPGWSTSTSEGGTVAPVAGQEDWIVLPPNEDNPYGAAGNADLWRIQFTAAPPAPLFADVSGDPEILASLTPTAGVYYPPGTLENVLLQILGRYGKEPLISFASVAYNALGYRVGYYVDDERSVRQAADDVAGGCLVWVVEADDGKVSFQKLLFPEEIVSAAWDVPEVDVVAVTRTPRADGEDYQELDVLAVKYCRSWTQMDATAIPPAVDAETRALLVNQWRTETVGDAAGAGSETPEHETYEVRRTAAVALGERALRLSQGIRTTVLFRYSPAAMFADFPIGDRLTSSWPSFGVDSLDGVIVAHVDKPGAGLVELSIWSDS